MLGPLTFRRQLLILQLKKKRVFLIGHRAKGTALNGIKIVGCTHAGHLDNEL